MVGISEAKRDFTDIRDMVRAYWLAIPKGEIGVVYNICSESTIQIKELFNNLLGLSSKKIEILKDPQRMRTYDVSVSQGNSSKFKNATDWRLKIPFEKTMEDFLHYWREKNDKN